jgi:bifunctional non-homologous end joining protein LigD
VAKVIFNALQLPSFIKTDGVSGLHIYLPLDGKDTFETAHTVAMYLCKLIKLKIPDVVTLKGSDDYVYGKVSLDYSLNEGDGHVVAPYSLIPGLVGIVAAPLLWEEVKEGLRIEDFTYDSIFRRLKESGDPFESLFKKRVSAASLLDRLEEHYAFLF